MSGTHIHRDDGQRVNALIAAVGGVVALVGLVAWGVSVSSGDASAPAPPGQDASGPAAPNTEGAAPNDRPSPQPNDEANDQSTDTGRQPGEELGWSEPVRVSIPSIDVSSGLEELSLDNEGAMTTPVDPDKAGWFTPGPAPGIIGAAVIAGHVTWDQAPAVFFELGTLQSGDRIHVAREDGVTVVFEVSRVGQFGKDEFPTDAVYGHTDRAALRLITCGGEYDEGSHRYADNVIVWAHMVGSGGA